MELIEYNLDETRRCWDCHKVYIPLDEFGNFVWCQPCKEKRFKAKEKNIITDELVQKIARKHSNKEFMLKLRK